MKTLILTMLIVILFCLGIMYAQNENQPVYCDAYTVENALERFEQGDVYGSISQLNNAVEAGKNQIDPWDVLMNQ